MSTLVESIRTHDEGRDPRRLAIKYEKMAASAFAFVRGACRRFYERLPVEGPSRDAPAAWICGDLHVEAFGGFRGDNGLVYFDLNDFDEACLAPLTWDLVRFQASLLLGADAIGIGEAAATALAARFADTYAASLAAGKPRWIERRTARGVVRKLLRTLARRDQEDLLDERAPERKGRRRIAVSGALAEVKALPVSRARRALVKRALARHAASMPQAGRVQVLDVKDRVAGTGSLGLDRYVVLARGGSRNDENLLLDLKASPASAPGSISPSAQPSWSSEAQRVVTLQRRLQAVPPALLTTLEVGNRAHVLRELLPSEDRIDLERAARKRGRLQEAVEDMAQVVAWAHLRGAGWQGAALPEALAAFGHDSAWRAPLGDLAQAAARGAREDHATFREAWADGALGPAYESLDLAAVH